MKNIFSPDFRFESVGSIPGDFFKSNGIKYVVCDIDNTLIDDNEPEPDERAFSFLERLKRENIGICLVSNNNKDRVAAFNKDLGLHAVSRAAKPLGFRISRAVKKMGGTRKNTILIGDQIFTDIIGGKAAGLKTLLVTPVNPGKETRFFKVKRYFEKKVLKDLRGDSNE